MSKLLLSIRGARRARHGFGSNHVAGPVRFSIVKAGPAPVRFSLRARGQEIVRSPGRNRNDDLDSADIVCGHAR
jgi:hypothetical protein